MNKYRHVVGPNRKADLFWLIVLMITLMALLLISCAGLRAEQQLPPRYVTGSTLKVLGVPILEGTEWGAGDVGRAVMVPDYGYGYGYGRYGGYGTGLTVTMPRYDPCYARNPRTCPPGSVWQGGR